MTRKFYEIHDQHHQVAIVNDGSVGPNSASKTPSRSKSWFKPHPLRGSS